MPLLPEVLSIPCGPVLFRSRARTAQRLTPWLSLKSRRGLAPVFSWWELLKTNHVVRFFDAADPKSLHRLFSFRRKPALWDYYDTTEMIRSEEIPKEVKDLPPPKKSRKGLLIVAALVLGLGFTWWRGNSMLNTNRPPAAAVASHVGASALGPSPASEVKALPPRELYAQAKRDLQWLVGVVNVQPGRWST